MISTGYAMTEITKIAKELIDAQDDLSELEAF